MKGTIKANVKSTKQKLLNNKKELSEHIMIVDLLRNDLNMISNNVKVTRFRYVDKIKSSKKSIYQVSSEIVGELEDNWIEYLDKIFDKLLPAGSISGTPKIMTTKLIRDIEGYKRGFFSGVWGVYNKKELDSAVIIRYIEKNKNGYMYKSGGGITLDSNPRREFVELNDKIYIGR